MDIKEALAVVRAAGYRVTKPKEKKAVVSQVGPTCVVEFADGTVCRMSTWAGRTALDWDRGIANCVAAYEVRHSARSRREVSAPPIVNLHFERDGKVLATRIVAGEACAA
jgi:hypothetical protein